MSDEVPLLKVLLHDRGEDPETVWAEDLGPAPGASGARRVRLDNVPLLHAKPTWGDEIVAVPNDDGVLAWDVDRQPYRAIVARLARDSGRWTMIVDYAPRGSAGPQACWDAIVTAARAAACEPESAWGPEDGRPGRAYFAVPADRTAEQVLARLRLARLPCDLTLVHPTAD
jgi:hypothetical protein